MMATEKRLGDSTGWCVVVAGKKVVSIVKEREKRNVNVFPFVSSRRQESWEKGRMKKLVVCLFMNIVFSFELELILTSE